MAHPTATPDAPGADDVPSRFDLARPEPTGAALVELIEVMDTLRRRCPWDGEQTHASLAKYLLEEVHEALAAIDDGDPAAMADELGDVLLQVYFHARVASERADGFTVDDVAENLATKLRRRHPHVFPDASGQLVPADTAGDVQTRWEQIKREERGDAPAAASIAAGIAPTLPALARAQKVLRRAGRRGLDVAALADSLGDAAADSLPVAGDGSSVAEDDIAAALLLIVQAAETSGVDAELALRKLLRSVEAAADAQQS